MKKRITLLLAMAVIASNMSVCACAKTSETVTQVSTEAKITMSADSSETTVTETTETTEEKTVDPWAGKVDASTAAGAAAKANSVLGKDFETIFEGDELRAFWKKSVSYNHESSCKVMIPDDGFEIEGIHFKKVYIWNGNGSVSKLTFAVRDREILPKTKNEAAGYKADLGFDSEKAMTAVVESLNDAFGDYKTIDAGLPNSKLSECFVWEYNETTIAVTYGVDCYGIEGNNEFKIEVYRSGNADGSQSDAGFRLAVNRMYGCFGQDLKTAKKMVQDILGVSLKKEKKTKSAYYYNVKPTFGGVKFNQIVIKTNPSGKVYEIYLIKDTSKKADANSSYKNFHKKLEALYGSNGFIPTNSYEYKGVIHGSRNGEWCIIGTGSVSKGGRFYFIFNNESLRKG